MDNEENDNHKWAEILQSIKADKEDKTTWRRIEFWTTDTEAVENVLFSKPIPITEYKKFRENGEMYFCNRFNRVDSPEEK